MCGICGILHFDSTPVDREIVCDMLQTIQHRGPDASGYYVDHEIGFGHARLSIIDLSGGSQPMSNQDGSVWITFNGEIYNYIELREELVRKGRTFLTSSDTEVLLQLYEEQGEDCVQRLNGQWAFAIWDRRQKRLFVSRDRMGVRPLFYAQTGHAFLFASEIKSLFAYPGVERALDTVALRQVFTLWHTIPPRTMFKGTSELPPGHCLSVQHGAISTSCYWRPEFALRNERAGTQPSEGEYAEELGKLLVDAVRIRLRSDVPVGAYLSGGLDSSLITALIRRFTSAPLETFSIEFGDREYDESGAQAKVVKYLDTTHHGIRCSYDELGEVFPQVVWHTEKPVLRTAPAPMFLLSRLVRRHGFKVVLTGEGSDEVLGGYDIFKETKIRSFWAAQPASHLRPLLLRKLYPYLPQIQSQPTEYLKIFFHVTSDSLLNPYFSHLPRWEMTRRLELLFAPDVTSTWTAQPAWHEVDGLLPDGFAHWAPFRRAQYLETAFLLPGYILSSQGDRMAMAHAVEGRFPFLDPHVIEFAAKLPAHLMMRGLREKHLLKRFADQMLPPDIVRRSKQPYRSPDIPTFLDRQKRCFRHAYAADLLSPSCLRDYEVFHCEAVQGLVQRLMNHSTGTSVRDSMALTGIISTQLLIHQFVRHFDLRRSHGRDTAAVAVVHPR